MNYNTIKKIKSNELYQHSCKLLEDHKKDDALYYLKEAAYLGNPDALFQLGIGYYYGIVVEKDIKYAIKLLKEASKNNNYEAMYIIAEYYYNTNKRILSKPLFVKLSKLGDKRAKYYCYLNGWDNQIDMRKAAIYNIERKNNLNHF